MTQIQSQEAQRKRDKLLGGGNSVAAMEFDTMSSISRSEIPLNRGRGHGMDLNDMQAVKDVNKLLDEIVRSGVSPHEIVKEIDASTPEMQKQKAQRKSFTESLRNLLKQCIKDHGLSGQIDIREYNRGERFFLVGREV